MIKEGSRCLGPIHFVLPSCQQLIRVDPVLLSACLSSILHGRLTNESAILWLELCLAGKVSELLKPCYSMSKSHLSREIKLFSPPFKTNNVHCSNKSFLNVAVLSK